jgi:hypothetical protein
MPTLSISQGHDFYGHDMEPTRRKTESDNKLL